MSYNPNVGTFIERDPIEADPNAYRYAGNAPTNATDPSGLAALGTPESLVPSAGPNSGVWGNNPPPQQYPCGIASPTVTVGDLIEFFMYQKVDSFALIFLRNHQLTRELQQHDYVKARLSALSNMLAKQCCDILEKVPDDSTFGSYRPAGREFRMELPDNLADILAGAVAWHNIPLKRFLGGFTLRLDYRNVDCLGGTAEVLATAYNETTWDSFTRIPGGTSIISSKKVFSQTFEWTQTVKFSAPKP